MPPMTIHDFRWDYFWDTFNYVSWYEIAMLVCFGISWPFSTRKMLKTGQTDGKSLVLPWLFVFGGIFGACHKLFVQLDVAIILYFAIAFFAFVDFYVCKRLRAKKAMAKRRGELLRRSRSSGRSKRRTGSSGRSSHHRRHERHTSSGETSDGRSHRRSSRASSESSGAGEPNASGAVPKEPKFADDVTLDIE